MVFQDRAENTHTKVSPEITTQIISHIIEFAAEKLSYYKSMFRVAEYYRVPNYTNYSSLIIVAEEANDTSATCVTLDKARMKHHSVGG